MIQRLRQQAQAELAHKISNLARVLQQPQPQLAAAAQHPMLPMPPQQPVPMLVPPYHAAATAEMPAGSFMLSLAGMQHEAVQP